MKGKIEIEQLINDLGNPAANQMVVTCRGKWQSFVSYGTEICRRDFKKNSITLGKCWKFSKTTSKHLYIYLRDYCRVSVYNRKDVEELIKNGDLKYTEKW